MSIHCPVCNRVSIGHMNARDFNRRIGNEIFRYYRCPDCSLIFMTPIPADLGRYYPDTYHSFPSSYPQLEQAAENERFKLYIVLRFLQKGRLLEIGPSYGGFAYLAKQAGFDVEALEMDDRCCKYLNDFIGIKATQSKNPVDGLTNANPYHGIVLWHVIEHLENPWQSLKAIADALLPGGVAIIAAPNPDAFQFRIMGRFWPHLDAPRHLSLIPLPLLKRKAEALGLKAVWSTTTDTGSLGWNRFGWEYFCMNVSSHRFFRKRLRYIGTLLSWVTAPIERLDGQGSAYTVVFVKEQKAP